MAEWEVVVGDGGGCGGGGGFGGAGVGVGGSSGGTDDIDNRFLASFREKCMTPHSDCLEMCIRHRRLEVVQQHLRERTQVMTAPL